MGVPELQAYIAPASRSRQPTDNFYQCCVYINGRTYRYDRGIHGGSDVRPKSVGGAGDPIVGGWPGRVVDMGDIWGAAFGRQLLLEHSYPHGPDAFHSAQHSHPWWSFHAHLYRYTISLGQSFGSTTQVAAMGRTGNVSNVHDHFQTHLAPYYGSGLVNPFPILERARLSATPAIVPGGGELIFFRITDSDQPNQVYIWNAGLCKVPIDEGTYKRVSPKRDYSDVRQYPMNDGWAQLPTRLMGSG